MRILKLFGQLVLPPRFFAAAETGAATDRETVVVFDVEEGREVRVPRLIRPAAEWKKVLTPEQYHVTVEKGTEPPFENRYNDNKEKGLYRCVRCGTDLFSSVTKFDSGTGWPSFWAPVSPRNVAFASDSSIPYMERVEVLCARCGSHLGHLFDDGPAPTYKRYCMNSAVFTFVPAGK